MRKETKTQILPILHTGKENAVHLYELAERLNVSEDTVKRCIQELRRDGEQIISGKAGYWLAETPQEAERFNRTLTRQAVTRLNTAQGMTRTTPEEREARRQFLDLLQTQDEAETRKPRTTAQSGRASNAEILP